MLRPAFTVFGIVFLLTGCIAVTEPLSNPNKAEPDKRLLGKWQPGRASDRYEIDSPAVEGLPNGLMRVVCNGQADNPTHAFWFFTTTIGKHTYMTIYLKQGKDLAGADFRQEGAFKRWHKENQRISVIVRYVLDGDTATVDYGEAAALNKVMRAEKIEGQPPPGWLAKYLEKNGPQTLYTGRVVTVWRRLKE